MRLPQAGQLADDSVSMPVTSSLASAETYLFALFAEAAQLILQFSPVLFSAFGGEAWYLMRQTIAVFLFPTTSTHLHICSNLSTWTMVDGPCSRSWSAFDVWHCLQLRAKSHKVYRSNIYLYEMGCTESNSDLDA